MHGPAGATMAGGGVTASSGARRSVARSSAQRCGEPLHTLCAMWLLCSHAGRAAKLACQRPGAGMLGRNHAACMAQSHCTGTAMAPEG